MNETKQKLKEILIECIIENVSIPQNFSTEDEIDIMGCSSFIDSLDLLSILVSFEMAIYDEFNIEVAFATEKAMSLNKSPFKNSSSLVDYAYDLLQETTDGE